MKITINDIWHMDNLLEIDQEIWFHHTDMARCEDKGLQSGIIRFICFDGNNLEYGVIEAPGSIPLYISQDNAFPNKEEAIEKIYNVKIQREES